MNFTFIQKGANDAVGCEESKRFLAKMNVGGMSVLAMEKDFSKF